jgi:DNA repair exonuclease SbcCD nuclease subunit
MATFRFLHIADVHLDTTFLSRNPDVRKRLEEDIRSAVERGVDLALSDRLDAVLIAGDLFDGDQLSFTTEQFLIDQIRRLDAAGITTVYVTGNHDHGGSLSRISGVQWPAKFHLISESAPVKVPIVGASGEPIATVVGSGHHGPRVSTNLAAGFPVADSELPTVGLLHALVTTASGIDSHDRYAPCTTKDLERTGYAYWALGHVHSRQSVADTTPAWYPGNIQGRHPGETGPKGGLLVAIEGKGEAEVSFVDLAPTRWETIVFDNLGEIGTLEELTAAVRRAFRVNTEHDEGNHKWILRVVFKGPCPLAKTLKEEGQLKALSEILVADLGVLDAEIQLVGVTPTVDISAFQGQPHILSEALDIIERARKDPTILSDLVSGHLAEDAENLNEYLLELLDGLDRELVSRMLVEGD